MKKKTKGMSHHVWENNNPIPSKDVIRVSGNHECFITGETIKTEDDAYWTQEFDAWISERGYQMINNAHSTGELEFNREWEIIFGEWYAKDETFAGREAEYHAEQSAKSNDDAGLYYEN
jgi:hypothetical protein